MISRRSVLFIVLPLLFLARQCLYAQTAVGIQPFGSYTGSFDQISLSSLAPHIDIPLFSHKARGANNGVFAHMVYDSGWSLSYGTATGGGVQVQQLGTEECSGRNFNNGTFTNFSYSFIDSTGYRHVFDGMSVYSACTSTPNPNPSTTLSEAASDGSGYLLVAGGYGQATVTDTSGNTYSNTSGAIITTDTNGNTGAQGGAALTGGGYAATITDNAGVSLQLAGGVYQDPSGSTPASVSPVVLTYTDTNGASQYIRVVYQTYSIAVPYDGTTIDEQSIQVSSITYPDGTSYQFQYQQDPSHPQDILGPLTTVTLPTGGSISYAYTGMSGDPYVTQPCSQTPITLSRASLDGAVNYSSLINSSTSAAECMPTASTTTISNPDQTSEEVHFTYDYYDFTTDPLVLETAHYWKNKAGGIIKSTMRCYNGSSGDCTSTSVSGPVGSIATTTTLDSSQPTKTVQFYNAQSLPTEYDEYDSGASTLLRKTVTAYAALGNNIQDRPHSISVCDGSGTDCSGTGSNVQKQTTYSYDDYAVVPTSNTSLPGYSAITGARGNLTMSIPWRNDGVEIGSTYHYDAAGQLVSSESAGGFTTSYAYDNATDSCLNQKTLPTTAAGITLVFRQTCDPITGLLATSVDPNNITTTYTYNAMLNSLGTTTTAADGTGAAQISISYSGSSLPTTITKTISSSPNPDQVTTTSLDGLGRTSNILGPDGATIATTYDGLGRVNSTSNPYFSTLDLTYGLTTFEYDVTNRMTQATFPYGTVQTAKYNGSSITVTDENTNVSMRQLDAFGRLSSVVEPSGGTTSYGYDLLNNTTSVVQHGLSGDTARTRTFTYDPLSRLVCASNPESSSSQCPSSFAAFQATTVSGVVSYGYYPEGNVGLKIDARGAQTSYAYDSLDRLTGIMHNVVSGVASTPDVVYTYDTTSQSDPANILGRLTDEKVTYGQTLLYERAIPAYNSLGRVATDLRCVPGACSALLAANYMYDLAGSESEADVTYLASPLKLNYGYDGAGRTTSVTGTSSNGTDSFYLTLMSNGQYSPFGSPSSVDGIETRTYDKRGRPKSISYDLSAANGPSYTATYDNYFSNGNLQELHDSVNGHWTYTYDSLNRIQTATSDTLGAASYSYDSFGNRNGQTGSATYNAQINLKNQIVSEGLGNQVACTNCYDAAGNLIADVPGTPVPHTYTYDAENRLSTISDLNIQYLYDGEGTRIGEFSENYVTGSLIKGYLREANNQFYTVINADGLNAIEFFGAGRHIATLTSSDLYLPFLDALGTERIRFGAVSGSLETIANLPFGDGLVIAGDDPSSLHFTGQERDTESNLDYFGARYYNSAMGRFSSPDPSNLDFADLTNPQSLNLYSYARNNPLILVDPSGLTPCHYTNDDGTDDFKNTDDDANCTQTGGSPVDYAQTVNVTTDGSGDFSLSTVDSGVSTLIQSGQLTAPSSVNCNTKLPNGQTVGSVVRQQRANLQNAFNASAAQAQTGTPSNPIGYQLGAFTSIALPNGPIDFKKGQTGQTFVQMGLAGNFAYYAIGAGYFSPSTLDAGAGTYGLIAAALFPHSTVHFSDLTGNFFSDSAAAQMRGPGLAANGCSVP